MTVQRDWNRKPKFGTKAYKFVWVTRGGVQLFMQGNSRSLQTWEWLSQNLFHFLLWKLPLTDSQFSWTVRQCGRLQGVRRGAELCVVPSMPRVPVRALPHRRPFWVGSGWIQKITREMKTMVAKLVYKPEKTELMVHPCQFCVLIRCETFRDVQIQERFGLTTNKHCYPEQESLCVEHHQR